MTLQKKTTTTARIVEEIENNFDFILSHFEQPVIFPRNVMATELIDQNKKYQRFKIVYSVEEALTHFQQYNYVDCRINAFPSLKKEDATWKPELLFIDLDLKDFKSIKSLELALSKTLKNIKEKLNGVPTILASGNGYHIIQPVECPIILEKIEQFSKYNKPSQEFLRFVKDFLSNGKADKNNYPSFNSCLLRVPGSINSKCLIDNRNRRLSGNFRVNILQSWDGIRSLITRDLLYNFHTYLNQKKANERNKIIRRSNTNKTYYHIQNNYYNYYEWIDKKILANPFSDHRKIIINLILAPYLVVIKKLSLEESYQIIYEWLQKCDLLRRLDFNARSFVNTALTTAYKKQIPPMRMITLKNNYKNLYFLVEQKEKIEGRARNVNDFQIKHTN